MSRMYWATRTARIWRHAVDSGRGVHWLATRRDTTRRVAPCHRSLARWRRRRDPRTPRDTRVCPCAPSWRIIGTQHPVRSMAKGSFTGIQHWNETLADTTAIASSQQLSAPRVPGLVRPGTLPTTPASSSRPSSHSASRGAYAPCFSRISIRSCSWSCFSSHAITASKMCCIGPRLRGPCAGT
jgi:hypothetical protein